MISEKSFLNSRTKPEWESNKINKIRTLLKTKRNGEALREDRAVDMSGARRTLCFELNLRHNICCISHHTFPCVSRCNAGS